MSIGTFVFPTSFAQRRLWFVHQLEPESPSYNIKTVLSLRGELDVPALERSLDAVVARHEAFRTTFRVEDGEPVQVITPNARLELPLVDRSGIPAGDREAEVERLIQKEVRRPFDLERGPLVRATLIRLAADAHVLVLLVHHIVFDGWSAGVLSHEVSECYRAFTTGETPRLPELPVQYADFAVWQREWLVGEPLERQLAYWRRQLGGAPAVLDLPLDFPRPRGTSQRGGVETLPLPRKLLADLTALGQREGATLFMTLLAGFQLLLSRYTGQEDIVVGSPIANRTRTELEHLIGFFVNTLALRTDLSGDPSFRELLRRVREVALGAYAHQDLPFDKVVEELQPQRVQGRNPVFQVMFVLQNAPRMTLKLPGVRLQSLPRTTGRTGTAKFDLTLFVRQTPRTLTASLEYDAGLFQPATMRRMLGHLGRLLEEVVASPDRRVSELAMVTSDEREQMLVAWNATAAPWPREQALHQLVEAQVDRTPEAVALAFGSERIIYAELDRRATQLAHHLRARGVGPEVRVGVYMERSPRLVIALLGILKAGGAYLPLDPAYPAERLRFLLQDAGAAALVADPRLLPRLAEVVPAVVALDQDLGVLRAEPTTPLVSEVTADHLAYVIYTSGSTGRPKGVGITHGNAVSFLSWARRTMGADAGARVLATTSISFDLSIYELFGTLSWGGTVELVASAMELPERADLQTPGAATLLNTVPSAAAALERLGAVPAGLARVNLAGEALGRPLVEALYAAGAGEVYNLYGPSETTTYSTGALVPSGETGAPGIGGPITNTRAYVLDRHGSPVPVGVAGELYLGGAGVARGYLKRPALTAERFVPDPFGPLAGAEPGGRLYRTGDRVRWRADGTLEFLGRMDHQVKLRGFRVEPGEIEAVLGQYPGVRECAVVLRDDLPAGQELVAYVVPRGHSDNGARPHTGNGGEHGLTAAQIRHHLRTRLPEQMVPSGFVVLDALPLTPNGKLDRRALPLPERAADGPDASFVAPRSPVESALAAIWQELLGVERVGLQDNFFELGGHSLLAVRLFAEIERTYHQRLPLSTLFQAPELGQLAEVLTKSVTPQPSSGPALLRPGSGTYPPLFVVHLHYGDVLEYRELVNRLPQDVTVYGCEAPVDGEGQPVLRTIEELAAHHVREIRKVLPTGPYQLCGLCWAGLVAFEMAAQLRQTGEEVSLLALIDTTLPGYERDQPVRRRVENRARQIWKLTAQNLRRLRALEVRAIPGFLRQRFANIVTRVAGVVAFRWSVRLQRPLLPVFREMPRALIHAGYSYRPRPYPGRITLFRVAPRTSSRKPDPFVGWGRIARDGFEVYTVAGGHNTLMREPHVESLAAQLLACLERLRAKPAAR